MRCEICGTTDLDGKMTVSGVGPVCYTCYQKPSKRSFREEYEQIHGKIHGKKPRMDRSLNDFGEGTL